MPSILDHLNAALDALRKGKDWYGEVQSAGESIQEAIKDFVEQGYADRPRVGVVAVIRYGEKILLGKRLKKDGGFGKWVFPGGGIQAEETFEQALDRECFEEVGLHIKLGELITATRSNHSGKNNVALIFWASPRPDATHPTLPVPVASAEIGTPTFFTFDEAVLLDVMPVTRDVFARIHATFKGV